MHYWLVKSEPSGWSWQDQLDAGEKGTPWDGVRNYQAANNMKAMAIGDLCFFYHSVKEKRIVGIVEVIETYHLDPSDESGRFGMVDVKAVKSVVEPVTLGQIKADETLAHIALVKQSRLSVMPIEAKAWTHILKMAQTSV